jgi:hypothetical protein
LIFDVSLKMSVSTEQAHINPSSHPSHGKALKILRVLYVFLLKKERDCWN